MGLQHFYELTQITLFGLIIEREYGSVGFFSKYVGLSRLTLSDEGLTLEMSAF